jgi:phosphoheptose isomerase
MDDEMVQALTTPAAIDRAALVDKLIKQIQTHSNLLQNGLENDKVLIVGREAAHISDKANLLAKLLSV